VRNADGENIFAAIKNNDFEVVNDLIQRGANVNATGMWSSTPLMVAIQYGHVDIINVLLDQPDINVSHINEKGCTALLYGCMEGNAVAVSKIINMGVDVNLPAVKSIYNPKLDQTTWGTPLSVACMNGYAEIVSYLIDAMCDVNKRFDFPLTTGRSGMRSIVASNLTPVLLAAAYGHADVLLALLIMGCDWSVVDSENNSVLHHISRCGETAVECFDLFLKRKRLKEMFLTKNSSGDGPIHIACDSKSITLLEKFLEFGADPNCINETTGATPLHVALKRKDLDLVELLLKYDANPTIEDLKNISPLMLARRLRRDSPILAIIETTAQQRYSIGSAPSRELMQEANAEEKLPEASSKSEEFKVQGAVELVDDTCTVQSIELGSPTKIDNNKETVGTSADGVPEAFSEEKNGSRTSANINAGSSDVVHIEDGSEVEYLAAPPAEPINTNNQRFARTRHVSGNSGKGKGLGNPSHDQKEQSDHVSDHADDDEIHTRSAGGACLNEPTRSTGTNEPSDLRESDDPDVVKVSENPAKGIAEEPLLNPVAPTDPPVQADVSYRARVAARRRSY
jgi:ankyrin repeat protein